MINENLVEKENTYYDHDSDYNNKNIDICKDIQNVSDSEVESETEINSDVDEENPENCEKINFIISLNEREWESIKPVQKLSRDKLDIVLQKGWTTLINKKTAKSKYRLPCPFGFNGHQVYKNGDIYFRFDGRCNDCKTFMHGECERKFADSKKVYINIYTFNTNGIPYTQKRALNGKSRVIFKRILLDKRVLKFRNERGGKDMNYGDSEPHDLNSSAVLRKARQEARDEFIKLPIHIKDPFVSLEYIKKYNSAIRHVTDLPPSVIYFTDNQMNLWDEISESEYSIAIADTTGSLIKTVEIDGRLSGHIFLHQLITRIHGYKKAIPITQMAAERLDVSKLKSWLKTSFKNKCFPKEFVTDGSLSLSNAISSVFNNIPYKLYLNKCYAYLKYKNINELPQSFIRHNRAHLIHAITR